METVILRDCREYDPERIRRIVREAIDELGLRPRGRVLVKPNLVVAGEFFPHAHTRPEFTEGVLRALRDRDAGIERLVVGERAGITIPTRLTMRASGHVEVARRLGVELVPFEEVTQVELPLRHRGRLRDFLFVPEPVARADFFVNLPKFKAHPWTTVTFGMKNYIGLQDDRHRLVDHDHLLDRKVADLQHVVRPSLVAVDAITAGEGRMLTPLPFDLGLVVLGANPVAVDAVCCRIIGVDPESVEHVRLARERGLGPTEPAHIRIAGDVSLEEARERASGFRVGLVRVEDYFRGTRIVAYGGRPPGNERDYCWGGCPGALEEAIEIVRVFDRLADERMPRMHIVFGRPDRPVDAREGERVFFVGDCAEYHGEIAGHRVDVEMRWRERAPDDPLHARHEELFAKMLRVRRLLRSGGQVVRLPGCPVSVAEQVLAIVSEARLRNPYFEPSQVRPFLSAYLSSRVRTLVHRLLGRPYQRRGPVEVGAAHRAALPAPEE